jgi:hypothetical protein
MSNANTRQVGGDHYRGSFQHWDWVIANNLGYLEGQITKYIARWRRKNGVQDLEKALHYADKLYEWRRDGTIPFRLRLPQQLAEVAAVYALTPDEMEIFRLVCEYRGRKDLVLLQRLIERLIAEAKCPNVVQP